MADGLKFVPAEFFRGRIRGWGMERSRLGRIVAKFSWVSEGSWSEEHQAVHMDEVYSFADGREVKLNWVLYADKHGDFVGVEAQRAASLKGRAVGDDFELTFEQPRAAGARRSAFRSRMRYSLLDEGTALMWGPISRAGSLPAEVWGVLRHEP